MSLFFFIVDAKIIQIFQTSKQKSNFFQKKNGENIITTFSPHDTHPSNQWCQKIKKQATLCAGSSCIHNKYNKVFTVPCQ